MAVPILQQGVTIQCPHGGSGVVVTTNSRVKAGGAFALLESDSFTVAGCPFQIPVPGGTKPQPCVTIEWQAAATRVKVGGTAVLLQSSIGLCKSAEGIVQGTAIVAGVQTRARGT